MNIFQINHQMRPEAMKEYPIQYFLSHSHVKLDDLMNLSCFNSKYLETLSFFHNNVFLVFVSALLIENSSKMESISC